MNINEEHNYMIDRFELGFMRASDSDLEIKSESLSQDYENILRLSMLSDMLMFLREVQLEQGMKVYDNLSRSLKKKVDGKDVKLQ